MADLTRRKFLAQASLGVAGSGLALTALGKLALPKTAAPRRSAKAGQGPTVAHVRDAATGEVAIMTGTQEIVVRDPELVDRLLRGA